MMIGPPQSNPLPSGTPPAAWGQQAQQFIAPITANWFGRNNMPQNFGQTYGPPPGGDWRSPPNIQPPPPGGDWRSPPNIQQPPPPPWTSPPVIGPPNRQPPPNTEVPPPPMIGPPNRQPPPNQMPPVPVPNGPYGMIHGMDSFNPEQGSRTGGRVGGPPPPPWRSPPVTGPPGREMPPPPWTSPPDRQGFSAYSPNDSGGLTTNWGSPPGGPPLGPPNQGFPPQVLQLMRLLFGMG